MRRIASLLLLLTLSGSILWLIPGCKKDGTANSSGDKSLNIYIWSEYLPQSVLDDFKARTGITCRVANYGSNEELLEKLQSGVSDYDIVVPSDYMVYRMAQKKLIRPLDKSVLKGIENIDPHFLGQKFDPTNQYSVPYFWGVTGVGYNTEKTGAPVDSWDALFDAKYKGQISMLDDGRECFAAALQRMGKGVNETDAGTLEQAAKVLKDQKALVRSYNSDSFHEKLATGDVAVAHGYNGQFAKVIKDAPQKLGFAVPKEGGTFWMDNLAISANAKHVEAAQQFINFVLEPAVAAKIAESVGYGTPNAAAKKLLKPEVTGNTVIYPSEDTLKRCKFMEDLGDAAKLVNKHFTEIKAQ